MEDPTEATGQIQRRGDQAGAAAGDRSERRDPTLKAVSARSPRIRACHWARVEVEGQPPLRDAMLFPGGAREWDWRTTGTGHRAGIQVADVRELLDRGAREIVLARGRFGLLRIAAATWAFLTARRIVVHALRTPAAVERYNALVVASDRPVGALIHSTC